MRPHRSPRLASPAIALLALALAGGCSTQPPAPDGEPTPAHGAPAPVPMPAPEPAAHGELPGLPPATVGCDPAPVVEGLLGQVADDALQARARAAAGAAALRMIRPGQPVTDDYREGRLNLQVDGANRVSGAYCG